MITPIGKLAPALALATLFLSAPLAHAATAGTIDSAHNFAWGNSAGWVNFAPTHSTIRVSDAGISGYAWSSNDGWINLSPMNGGVTNDGSGVLGGFAWDSSAGWISFVGVTIDSAGQFHGQATGANGYNINFDCTKCDVRTDWHRISGSGGSSRSASAVNTVSSEPAAGTTETASIPAPPSQQPTVVATPTPAESPTVHTETGGGIRSSLMPANPVQTTQTHVTQPVVATSGPVAPPATTTSWITKDVVIVSAGAGVALLIIVLLIFRFLI